MFWRPLAFQVEDRLTLCAWVAPRAPAPGAPPLPPISAVLGSGGGVEVSAAWRLLRGRALCVWTCRRAYARFVVVVAYVLAKGVMRENVALTWRRLVFAWGAPPQALGLPLVVGRAAAGLGKASYGVYLVRGRRIKTRAFFLITPGWPVLVTLAPIPLLLWCDLTLFFSLSSSPATTPVNTQTPPPLVAAAAAAAAAVPPSAPTASRCRPRTPKGPRRPRRGALRRRARLPRRSHHGGRGRSGGAGGGCQGSSLHVLQPRGEWGPRPRGAGLFGVARSGVPVSEEGLAGGVGRVSGLWPVLCFIFSLFFFVPSPSSFLIFFFCCHFFFFFSLETTPRGWSLLATG